MNRERGAGHLHRAAESSEEQRQKVVRTWGKVGEEIPVENLSLDDS